MSVLWMLLKIILVWSCSLSSVKLHEEKVRLRAMSERHLDVLLIGSGTSAHYCAHGLRDAGKTVTVVDEREFG